MDQLLQVTSHRPYHLPSTDWIMTQTWVDLLFAHWPVARDTVRALVPAQFELDTFDGFAWVAVVPFGMTAIRFRYTPEMPGVSAFLEMNVRTYVRYNGKAGVYFFSLDAENPLAVETARSLFHLPYFNARMSKTVEPSPAGNTSTTRTVLYSSERRDKRGSPGFFEAAYAPIGDVFYSKAGTLEHWLTERYCLFTTDTSGQPCIGEIHHEPWPLQPAEADIRHNTMLVASGIKQPADKPLLHFAGSLRTLEWALATAHQM